LISFTKLVQFEIAAKAMFSCGFINFSFYIYMCLIVPIEQQQLMCNPKVLPLEEASKCQKQAVTAKLVVVVDVD
jgi:hypothetical protein